MIRSAAVLATALVLAGCAEPEGVSLPPREPISISLEEGTVVCPDDYANAGQEFSYVTDDELSWSERASRDKYEEKGLAERKIREKHCGERSMMIDAVCPSDREQAGKAYIFDLFDSGSQSDRVERHCGLTEWEAEAEQARIQQAENDREAGSHCLSAWDGNFNNLEHLVRSQLLNPSSMETVSTAIASAMPNGKHRVEMVFRATNQYGAVVTATALGSAHSDSCIAELFSIDGQIITDAGCSHEIFGIIACE